MDIQPLSLTHKDILADRLKALACPISEYSFANLYLFREVHQYEVVFDREVFIRGITYDRHRYLMPTFDISVSDIEYLISMMQDVDFLFPIDEPLLKVFDPDRFTFTAKEGDMDYVYTAEKMKTYKGRRLHKKRNLMKQFLDSYSHHEFALTHDKIKDAVSILEEWQRDNSISGVQTDYGPCKEALMLNEELCMCGIIYYVEDEPAGFVLGEELNSETFVLHFVKAKKRFKGIYQYMYNSFANLLPVRYRYLNFEQDLDREALRLAKSSYLPDIMLKKYRVGLKRP
jgi:hypothetical protein